VAALGVDAAAGQADVAKEKLQHGGRVDQLHGVRVMCPAQGVENGADFAGLPGATNYGGGFFEIRGGAAANFGDLLRRVARVVPLHGLKDRERIFQCGIYFGVTAAIEIVLPGRFVVALLLFVPAAEMAFAEREVLAQQEGGVGVRADVIHVAQVVGNRVVDQAAEEGDVSAGAEGNVGVADGGGTVETGVDTDELGLALALGVHHEAEADGMIFRRITAHDQNDIGVGDVAPAIGHCPSSKCGGQTDHRGAVSKPGLVFVGNNAEAETEFTEQEVDLVGIGAAADEADGVEAINSSALGVLIREVFVACVLDAPRDALNGFVPGDVAPFGGAGRAIERLGKAAVIHDELFERDTFGAEGAAIDGVVGIAFDVDYRWPGVLHALAGGVNDNPAADGAIRADALDLIGPGNL